MATGFATLGYLAARTYRDAPPIPARVVDPLGATLFTGQDIIAGQQVFLSHGLMENGTIWGHGAYLGPVFLVNICIRWHSMSVARSQPR
jgi:nitric oxide reductase subunit B